MVIATTRGWSPHVHHVRDLGARRAVRGNTLERPEHKASSTPPSSTTSLVVGNWTRCELRVLLNRPAPQAILRAQDEGISLSETWRMAKSWADRTWRPFGRMDPYYGVCSDDRFRADRMDAEARRAFFQSGEEHVGWVMDAVRRTVVPGFNPSRILDFGCGVGRLVLPFARIAEEVVGADIAPEMLAEAQRNSEKAGLDNTSFVRVDDSLNTVTGRFDLVHAFIVFQHIPPARGEQIALSLVEKLAPGGVAALHFTYRREARLSRKIVHALRKRIPGANLIANLAQGRASDDPFIPMYSYRLQRLVDGFRRAGCSEIHMMLTDHGGHLGAMMLLRVGP